VAENRGCACIGGLLTNSGYYYCPVAPFRAMWFMARRETEREVKWL